MSNIATMSFTLFQLEIARDSEIFCECDCCGNGPIDWKLVRSLEEKIAAVELELDRELAAEEEALEFEALELAA